MILTLIGLSLSFIGTFAIIIETISGSSIRPKIYNMVYKGVYQFTGDYTPPVKIKLNYKEKRVLCWMILICVGFLFQILDFIPKQFWISLMNN